MANKTEKTKMIGEKSKLILGETKEKRVWSCDYCQKEFYRLSHLKSHLTVHTGQKDHHCNLCDYSTAHKSHLTGHIRSHLKERPFKCQEPNCGAEFTESSNLTRHQLIHSNNEKRFSCSACRYKTNTTTHLNRHMRTVHSGFQPFKCPQQNCDYSAKEKSNLNQHLKTHSEEKNEVCPHPNCGFRTKTSWYLKAHMRSHLSGEKRFKCFLCDFSAHHQSSLDFHIRRHTGETPFACPLCSFRSKGKSDLNRHMKKHGD